LVRIPVGYFRSRKLKKYHSFSPILAFSATQTHKHTHPSINFFFFFFFFFFFCLLQQLIVSAALLATKHKRKSGVV
jgi:hypothetical protein